MIYGNKFLNYGINAFALENADVVIENDWYNIDELFKECSLEVLNENKFTEGVKKVFAKIKEIIDKIIAQFKEFFKKIKDATRANLKKISNGVANLTADYEVKYKVPDKKIMDKWEKDFDTLSDTLQGFSDMFFKSPDHFIEFSQSAYAEEAKEIIDNFDLSTKDDCLQEETFRGKYRSVDDHMWKQLAISNERIDKFNAKLERVESINNKVNNSFERYTDDEEDAMKLFIDIFQKLILIAKVIAVINLASSSSIFNAIGHYHKASDE